MWSVRPTDTLPDPRRPAPSAPVSTLGWLLLLAVAAAVAWVVVRGQRKTPSARGGGPRAVPSGNDMKSLGLSEVRALEPGAAREPARPEPPRPAPPRAAAAPGAGAEGGVAPDPVLWPGGADPARHLITSLAAHVAGVAGVLRYDAAADAYVAEAVAGAPRPAPLPAERCPLHRAPQDGELTLLDGAGGMGPFAGDVYVRALAAPPAARAFLVVAPGDAGADALDAVGRYADLLAEISDLSAPAAPPPRVVVIGEEQDAAHAEGRPLAFALVTLAEAEDILAREEPAEAAAAERRLRRRLADDPDVRRTEPFGDLLVGVFLDLEPDGVAAWCERTSAGSPALFIGAVAPVDGDAADVRAAAAAALHDAYDQQRTQVVAG